MSRKKTGRRLNAVGLVCLKSFSHEGKTPIRDFTLKPGQGLKRVCGRSLWENGIVRAFIRSKRLGEITELFEVLRTGFRQLFGQTAMVSQADQ